MSKEGLIIVLSAPSGAGKSTLCSYLVEKIPSLRYSISYTTRPPRYGEKDKVDYFFVTGKKFKNMVRRRGFVEWAKVHGHYYGTPKHYLEEVIGSGKDIILDIDVQGGVLIKKFYPRAVLIFVMAPSMKMLEQRLRQRKKDSEEVIRRRLINARKELRFLPKYDYLVINDRLKSAEADLRAIIAAEHLRIESRSLPSFDNGTGT